MTQKIKTNYILEGDCLIKLKELPDNSIDSVVTDPPYELGFMGKSWDSTGIAFNVAVWQECLRVLKPGGHLLAFSGSRTYHRMAVAIEDAGFEIRDQIMWVYGSGFPKSLNISKAIDKSDAVEMRRQRDLKFVNWMRTTGLKQKQINDIIEKSDVGSHYLRLDQPAVATAELFNKLRPHLPEVPEWVEQMVAERTIESENFKKREVIGVQKNAIAGWSMDGTTKFADRNITESATKEAKQWDGWGTALKPAHEPIVMARKPLGMKTVAENVLTYGTGGINIDGTRVGTDDKWEATGKQSAISQTLQGGVDGSLNVSISSTHSLGRFPANFIHDGSDEVVELLGEAARFFYCAKASKKDRNEGLYGFTKIQTLGGGGLTAEIKDDGTYDTASAGGKFGSVKALAQNHHPTVKPTELMKYLITLVTPPKGIVLDPFLGSGSTAKAAELLGFKWIVSS